MPSEVPGLNAYPCRCAAVEVRGSGVPTCKVSQIADYVTFRHLVASDVASSIGGKAMTSICGCGPAVDIYHQESALWTNQLARGHCMVRVACCHRRSETCKATWNAMFSGASVPVFSIQ